MAARTIFYRARIAATVRSVSADSSQARRRARAPTGVPPPRVTRHIISGSRAACYSDQTLGLSAAESYSVLVHIPRPAYCSLDQRVVQLLAYELFMSRAAAITHPTRIRLAPFAMSVFYAHLVRSSDRFRIVPATSWGSCAGVQPRPARPQRTQHHTHPEPGAEPQVSPRSACATAQQARIAVPLLDMRRPLRRSQVAAAMARAGRGEFGNRPRPAMPSATPPPH